MALFCYHKDENLTLLIWQKAILIIQMNLRLQPRLASDHLPSATSFPKYQKFSCQLTIFGTSCKRPTLVRAVTTFRAYSLKISFTFNLP